MKNKSLIRLTMAEENYVQKLKLIKKRQKNEDKEKGDDSTWTRDIYQELWATNALNPAKSKRIRLCFINSILQLILFD